MKRFFLGALFIAVFTVGLSSSAFAAAALELVSGGSTLYVADNGAVACSGPTCAALGFTMFGDSNGAAGQVVIGANNFNGWVVTVTTGGSNSPACSGPNVVGCLGDTAITARSTGAGSLGIYFADTGFAPVPGYLVTFSSPAQSGVGSVATQTAYNFAGANPLGLGVLAPVPGGGQIGIPLVSPFPGLVALSTGGPGGNSGLELATVLTTTAAGGNFQIQGNIQAVPEPGTVVLFGTVLVLTASFLRRRRIS